MFSYNFEYFEFSETIDSCHYYLALSDDQGFEVTPANDPFVQYFDPANHVLVFGTNDDGLDGATRNYVLHAVSSYSGYYASVPLSFTISTTV